MNQRTITTPDYQPVTWKAGDKLKASQLTTMSSALDAVENEVRTIGEQTIPTINASVTDLQSQVSDLTTANQVIDLPEGQTLTQYVDQSIADLVDGAPETLNTLKELSDALQTNGDAVDALESLVTENGTAIDEVSKNVEQLSAQVETLDETTPKFSVYQYTDPEGISHDRRAIQLDNYDNLTSVSTTGEGVNLIMMSRWDKVDIGTPKYQMNLNSPEGLVTINDSKTIATVDQIPDTSAFATTMDVDAKLATKADVDHTHTIDQVETLQDALDGKQPAGDYPVYQKFSAGADPAERKTIQLANADSISGVSSSGMGANLIMMSKWDKVDIGSANFQMNLNSTDGVVQINDELVVATTRDLQALTKSSSDQANSMFVNSNGQISFSAASKDPEGSQVGVVANNRAFTVLCNYRGSNSTALNAQITPNSFIVKTVDAEGQQSSVDLLKAVQPEAIADMLTKTEAGTTYATKEELASKVDASALSMYATKEELGAKVDTSTLSTYATKEELASKADASVLSTYATKDELSAKADASAIADMLTKTEAGETYATQDQLASKANVDHTHTIDQVTDLQTKLDAKIEQPVIDRVYEVLDEMNSNSAKALDTKVSWDQQKKVISLPKDGSISAMRGDPIEGTEPEGGVLLAQRSYDDFTSYVTEVGTTKNKLTLNASERPQVDVSGSGSEKIAYLSEIPDVSDMLTKTEAGSTYATKEELAGKVDASALSTYATKDDLSTKADVSALSTYATKEELTNKADTSALSAYATKEELAGKVDTSALSTYATKDELGGKVDTSAIADMLTKTEAGETYVAKADNTKFNDLMFGKIDWQKYKDSKYATQILTNVEQSFFDDLGNPENINGQPYNAGSNNYKTGNDYLCFGGFDEGFTFHYDLWDVEFEAGLCGQVMTSLATALSTYEQSTSKSLKDLQDKYTALEARVATLESK